MQMRILALVMVFAIVVSTTGCVTRSSRDWGYVDTGTQQVTTTYIPVQPSAVPNQKIPSSGVNAALQMQPLAAQQAAVIPNAYAVNNNRLTYEHNSESFNLSDITPYLFLGLGIFNSAMHWDHMAWSHGHWRHRHW